MWCEDIGFDNWYDKYEYNNEVMEYLHGKCHQWVIHNYQDGDKCVAVMEEREYVDHLCLMHCCLLRDGQYLDEFKEMLKDIDIPYEDVLEVDTMENEECR